MFKKLLPLKPDPILGIVSKINNDIRKNIINLTVGELYFYENNQKKLFDYNFIMNKLGKKPTEYLSNSSKYLPITGCTEFINLSEKFIFGNNRNRSGLQTLSGTGSLTVGNQLLSMINTDIYIPHNSWPNHFNIFSNHKIYKTISDLDNIPDNSTVLFHTCCNNPTGIDYTDEEWEHIIYIMRNKNHLAFFDSAYLGLSSGSVKEDVKYIRTFENNNIPLIVSTSYAKNFGLYGQRIGSLFFNLQNKSYEEIYLQYLKRFIRTTYSNPPRAGAEMASFLMSNEILLVKWNDLINTVLNQQKYIRNKLSKELGWDVLDKKGLFFISPLNIDEIIELREKYAIYLLENGRINISGLNIDNIDRFVECVKLIKT